MINKIKKQLEEVEKGCGKDIGGVPCGEFIEEFEYEERLYGKHYYCDKCNERMKTLQQVLKDLEKLKEDLKEILSDMILHDDLNAIWKLDEVLRKLFNSDDSQHLSAGEEVDRGSQERPQSKADESSPDNYTYQQGVDAKGEDNGNGVTEPENPTSGEDTGYKTTPTYYSDDSPQHKKTSPSGACPDKLGAGIVPAGDLNSENFDDGLTQVAPEGEFKPLKDEGVKDEK